MVRRFFRVNVLMVTMSYMAVNFFALLLLAAPLLYAWHEMIEKRSTEMLQEDLRRLSRVYENHGIQSLSGLVDIMAEEQTAGNEVFILLTDANRRRLAGNLKAWPDDLPPEPGIYPITIQANTHLTHAMLASHRLKGGLCVIIGRNTAQSHTFKMLFWSGFSVACVLLVFFGLMGRLLIRRALLTEINRISATAQAIVTGDLSRRLEKYQDSELDLLIDIVNRILDQMQQIINSNRHVSDAIAHDLRTPLTELRFRLEALTLGSRPIDHVCREIDSAIVDVDRVILIFNALLRLAEIDHNARYSGFEQVDIVRMIDDVVDFYRPLAELKQLQFHFSCDQHILAQGDPLLLTQAVGNLIDNALKYTLSKVVVEVTHLPALNQIAISVIDDGAGVSDEEKPRIIERFYRSSNSQGKPGVGLGLSLVVAVARLHGGTLEFDDRHPGLRATLVIVGQ